MDLAAALTTLDFLKALLALGADEDLSELWERIWWRVDDGVVRVFVLCNDLFWWATADAEPVTTIEDVTLLRSLATDARAALGIPTLPTEREAAQRWWNAAGFAADLYCARKRQMRPQSPCYDTLPKELHALFDACGPKRARKEEG